MSHHSFYQRNPTQVVFKHNFCAVFCEAWLHATSPANVCSGYKRLGFSLPTLYVLPVHALTEEPKQDVSSNTEEEGKYFTRDRE